LWGARPLLGAIVNMRGSLAAFGSSNTLKVKIISAKNLRDADWGPFGGESDPYVRIRIVDDDDHSKELASAKTKVLNEGGKNPVWNQEFTFPNLEHPGAYTIKLNVLDKDWLTADDPLGETSVDLGTLTAETGWQEFKDVWIDGYVYKSYLTFALSTGGGWGSTPDEDDTLYVNVKEAHGLRNADGWLNGKNDPYCIVSVLDNGGKTLGKFQTSVKDEAGQDVEWNEEFTFENLVNPGASRLKLDVYDKDHWTPDDNLGEVIFHLGTLKCHPEPQEFTLALMKHPGKITFTLDNKGQWGYGKHKGIAGVPICNECNIL